MTEGPTPTDSTASPDDDAPPEAAPTPAVPTRPALAGITDAWSRLNQTAQLVAGSSIAAIVITLIGLPIGAWDSTNLVLLMLVATIATAVTAWVGGSATSRTMAIPLPVVEVAAGAVAAVLAILNLIEALADIEDMDRGGIVGLILSVALAVAGAAIFVGALRRLGGARSVLASSDQWARITLCGLALVLVGWALNLSVGYWVINAAALSLAILTLAAAIIVLTRQIASPIPPAWVGVALGIFGALLAIGLWGELAELGENRVELSILDIIAFLIYVVGILLIVAGGILIALEQGTKRVASDAPPPPAS